MPHEVKAMIANGTLAPPDYDDYTEGIVNAALAAANTAARAGPVTHDHRGDALPCHLHSAAIPVCCTARQRSKHIASCFSVPTLSEHG